MPPWDTPSRQDELERILRDLDAAERLCEALPEKSRDREMVERTIAALNAQILALLLDGRQAE